MMNNTMHIPIDETTDVYQCSDCGAYVLRDTEDATAFDPENPNIKHFDGCVPGDAKRWEEYYNKVDEE